MTQVTIHEAKTHLSRLIEKVLRGEEVVIAKRSKPVVRMVIAQPKRGSKGLGALRGYVGKLPEGWDVPFDESDLRGGALDAWLDGRQKPKRKHSRHKSRKAA